MAASTPAASQVPREKLRSVIVKLLEQKSAAVVEVEKRIRDCTPLVIKGINVDVSILKEALAQFKASCPTVAKPTTAPAEVKTPLGVQNIPVVSPSAGTFEAKTSVPTISPSIPALPQSARWSPAPSVEALASKAMIECETAEPFCTTIKVSSSSKVAVLPKPNALCRPTGEYLQAGDSVEVIARKVEPKDGRVYFRLRKYCGWVSTRSRKEFHRVVLESLPGNESLEPQSCGALLKSFAARLLDRVDDVGRPVGRGAAVGSELAVSPNGAVALRAEKFRATMRCPILSTPDNGTSTMGAIIGAREDFLADGAYTKLEDGRVFLHLQDGRGWVCERPRHDFTKLACEPCDKTVIGNDALEIEEGSSTSLLRRAQPSSLGQKVIMVERTPAKVSDVAAGHVAEQIGTCTTKPRESRTLNSRSRMASFRSDRELWPDALGPARPISASLRTRLRRLHGTHGAKVQECDGDIKELETRISSYGRSCPAQKELKDYADALQTEAEKLRKQWVKAVEEVLTDSAAGEAKENDQPQAVDSSCVPVQVRGERWYCARMQTMQTVEQKDAADDAAGVASIFVRRMGPLRSSTAAAQEDFKRMMGHANLDGEAAAKRHCSANLASQSGLMTTATAGG